MYIWGKIKDMAVFLGSVKKEYPALRVVKVTYDDGDVITTSMAAHLTDKDIKEYFRIGKKFNIGSGEIDRIVAVKKVKILR